MRAAVGPAPPPAAAAWAPVRGPRPPERGPRGRGARARPWTGGTRSDARAWRLGARVPRGGGWAPGCRSRPCPLGGPRSCPDVTPRIRLPGGAPPQMETLGVGPASPRLPPALSSPGSVSAFFLRMKPQFHPSSRPRRRRLGPSHSPEPQFTPGRRAPRPGPAAQGLGWGWAPFPAGPSAALLPLKGLRALPRWGRLSGGRWAQGCGRGRPAGNVRGPGGCCPWPLGRLRPARGGGSL